MSLNELSEVARLFITSVAIGLMLVGLFFLFVAAVGVLRLPDVFTRSHAVSLTDSLGARCLGGWGTRSYCSAHHNVAATPPTKESPTTACPIPRVMVPPAIAPEVRIGNFSRHFQQ